MCNITMAGNLLNSTPNLPALTTLELSAQIQAQQGDLKGAILMLESVRPQFHETSYYALRANLYQQAARYAEAASLYRRLLDDEPNHSAFWLGLAVCLDAMNSTTEALGAFEKTRDGGQYDGEVLRYVQERIAVLSR
jgi:MSHA biogenesis protein MshN